MVFIILSLVMLEKKKELQLQILEIRKYLVTHIKDK